MAHLINPIVTPAQLEESTSFSNLPQDLQEVVFVSTQRLTQAAGLLLELPQSVTAQANVLLARYWLSGGSPMIHEPTDTSAAALYLAAKIGPIPRSPRDMANVYAYLLSPSSALFDTDKPRERDVQSYYQTEADYHAFQIRLHKLEAHILYSLAFDTHVSLPHPLAVTYLQTLDFLDQPKSVIARRVTQYLNTALLSPQMLYLTHQPHALATAAIYNAARDLGAKMPQCEWWEVFDVDREELGFLVVGMRSVEGIWRRRVDEMPWARSMPAVTRSAVEGEMKRRGLYVGNGSEQKDEEDEVMQLMDSKG